MALLGAKDIVNPIYLFHRSVSLDVFSPGMSIGEIMLALLMHNIPTLFLIVILVISWKYEIVGGICFILAGMMYIFFALSQQIAWYIAITWSLTIAGPAILVGVLFLLNWTKKRKK